MPDFDPDKYLVEKAQASTFNPDKYLAEKSKSPPMTLKGAAESVGAGLASGIYNAPLMGVARRSGAAVNAGLESILDAQRAPADRKSFGDRYDQNLAEDAAAQAKREAEHPTASKVGNVAVSASMAALPLPFGKVPGAAGAALRTGSTAGLAGLDAATQGQNVDLEKAKQEATLGAGLQGGLEAAGGTLGLVGKAAQAARPGLDRVSNYIEDLAKQRGLKAGVGQNKKVLKDLGSRGQQVAQDIMQPNQIISEPAVRFGSTIEKVGERASENKGRVWDAVQEIHNKVDEATGGKSVSGDALAKNILDRAAKIEPLPQNQSVIEAMQNNAEYLKAKGALSLKDAQALKNNFAFKQSKPQTHALGLDGNNQIREAFSEEMGKAVAQSSPDDAEKLKKAMGLYGSYKTVSDAAKDRGAANVANRWLSPSDYGVASTGALLGGLTGDDDSRTQNILIGAAAGLGNRVMRQRGPAASAVLLDKISKTLQQSPETFGRFRGLMERAAKQGGPALIGAHLMMQQSQGKGDNEAIRPD